MKTRIFALSAGLLATALVLAGCADGTGTDGAHHGAGSTPSASAETSDAVFNDADVTFASGMVMHHQQAIEMSDTLLAKEDVDPQVADLAERIKAAQQPEIDTMNAWLTDWGQEPAADGMHHGGGMMSEDDMAALEDADGPEASTLFLEQMIVHHEGAVEMAETEIADGENPDATALAEKIVEDQTAEIAEMQDLLADR